MKFLTVALVLGSILLASSYTTIDREEIAVDEYERNLLHDLAEDGKSDNYRSPDDDDQSTGWKTWNALKNAFRPATNWFINELPKKTPQDLYKDAADTAVEAKDWAKESKVMEVALKVWEPIQNWITKTANDLKRKTFKTLYEDTKEAAGDADDYVGTWVDDNLRRK